MKKTLSITFIAAVVAVGSAFAGKLKEADIQWMLNDNTIVTGDKSFIKLIYCSGANDVQCAIDINNGFNIIYRP